MTVRPALPDEVPAAFDLLFAHLSDGERLYRAARAVALVAQGDLDPRGVFVVGDEEIVGVCVCQPVPGAGALIWPPKALRNPDVEDALVAHACGWLRDRGSRLVQCLLDDAEAPLGVPLLRNGFAAITGLTYLRHDLQLAAPLLQGESHLTLDTYTPATAATFHNTLARSYQETLDCPEVNGVRSIAEVIAGHQAQGRHDPTRWWLACREYAAVGVLLVTEPDPGEWEVAYVGVVPEGRRQGYGRELVLHALCEARAAGVHRVTLAVDDRNGPAMRLYRRLGFERYDHRLVVLRIWG